MRPQPNPVAGNPTPRTTTRGDARPTPTPRYTPTPGATPRGDAGRTPLVGGTRPTPRSQPTPRPADASGRPSVVRSRYDTTPRTPSSGEGRPRVTAPSSGLRPVAQPSPTRGTAPVGARPTAGRATVTPGPRLVPRAAAPTLGVTPRANPRPIVSGQVATAVPRYGFGNRFGCANGLYGGYWGNWWNPCGWNTWGWGGGWGGFGVWPNQCSTFAIGFGPRVGFVGGWSWWHSPWWAWRGAYWNDCYTTAWYYSACNPWCAPTSFWWYPSSVYCPTYLYVPSTVTVVNVPASSTVTITDDTTSPSNGPTVETQVAGSEVQGSARMVEVPANAADEQTANDLASKYSELGDFYFRANRFTDASAAYGKARAYAPSDAQLHFVLADAAFASGDYPYAAFLIGEGLRLDPALATATTDKRTFYGDAKTFAEQQATLDAYVAKKPYDAPAHLVRGYNLRFSGDAAAARAAFERVLQIDPDNRPARTFLAGMAPNEAGDGTR
ncbi:MAG: hypothetical protein ACK501_20430 [Planctomycetota bacterium]